MPGSSPARPVSPFTNAFIKRVGRSRAAMLLRVRRIEGRFAPVRVCGTSSAQRAITEFTGASDQRSSLTTFVESTAARPRERLPSQTTIQSLILRANHALFPGIAAIGVGSL
jgi:hypothetical protein